MQFRRKGLYSIAPIAIFFVSLAIIDLLSKFNCFSSVIRSKIFRDNLLCDTSSQSFEKCITYADSLAHYDDCSNGYETILKLKGNFSSLNETLTNASLYWNESDRFKPFRNASLSTDVCHILYCGANRYGGDGLVFMQMYEYCQVWFLEPISVFYDQLTREIYASKQKQIGKHHMYNIGLSSRNQIIDITMKNIVADHALSLFPVTKNGSGNYNSLNYKVILRDISEILFEFRMLTLINQYRENINAHGDLDVLHMNCEGCEYEVIERLVETNLIKHIKTIQFGSHRTSAVRSTISQRYCCVQQMLSRTHILEFGIPWGWERWLRKDLAS